MAACFVAGSKVTNGMIEDAQQRSAFLQHPDNLKKVLSRNIEVHFLKRARDPSLRTISRPSIHLNPRRRSESSLSPAVGWKQARVQN
jgi:hypothetical protein